MESPESSARRMRWRKEVHPGLCDLLDRLKGDSPTPSSEVYELYSIVAEEFRMLLILSDFPEPGGGTVHRAREAMLSAAKTSADTLKIMSMVLRGIEVNTPGQEG